jgi:hypothetical protein
MGTVSLTQMLPYYLQELNYPERQKIDREFVEVWHFVEMR